MQEKAVEEGDNLVSLGLRNLGLGIRVQTIASDVPWKMISLEVNL